MDRRPLAKVGLTPELVHRFWDIVSEPLLNLTDARAVVEIGAASGAQSRRLAAWCRPRGASLVVIDPAPRFPVSDLHDPANGIALDVRLSIDALAAADPVDVAFVDGDHNYYTVRRELELLHDAARRAGAEPPVVLCHDVGWPYGRRDLYYDPETVPAEHRQPWRRAGIVEGQSELMESGGLNAHLCNATHEGGPRNGVRTAIEDFVAEAGDDGSMHVTLPVLYGLSVLVPSSRLARHAGLGDWLQRWEAVEGWAELAALAETHRRAGDVALQALSGTVSTADLPRPAHASDDAVRGRPFRPALPTADLERVQHGIMRTSYRDIPFYKSPFDVVLYQELLGHLRPGTVLEIGTKHGGSALWFADVLTAHGLAPNVVSVDLENPPEIVDDRIAFIRGDAGRLGEVLDDAFMAALPRPLFVIEDSAHRYDTTLAVLEFVHPYLAPGDYVVVEDGVLADFADPWYEQYEDGPNRAVRQFLDTWGDEYEIATEFCDRYGHNVTWAPNAWLRRRQRP